MGWEWFFRNGSCGEFTLAENQLLMCIFVWKKNYFFPADICRFKKIFCCMNIMDEEKV